VRVCVCVSSRQGPKEGEGPVRIDWKEALWMATRGGAEALGLGDVVGALEKGKAFDALLVDVRRVGRAFSSPGAVCSSSPPPRLRATVVGEASDLFTCMLAGRSLVGVRH
jgi:cytosine/adenosine deaminase-related metal-dependent hydrolase